MDGFERTENELPDLTVRSDKFKLCFVFLSNRTLYYGIDLLREFDLFEKFKQSLADLCAGGFNAGCFESFKRLNYLLSDIFKI